MSELLKPDICVIGAGSGGLSVAAAAAAFGVSVVLIEKARMGGDCLNTGCVPSKALIAAGNAARTVERAAEFGIFGSLGEVDFPSVHDHVHEVIAHIEPNDSVERFTGMGVRVIQAEGRFVDTRTVEAGAVQIRARRFVIATGSRAAVPPIPGLADSGYLTNETIFDNKVLPDHLIVIGGGPIGMELAQAHRRLGAGVTVLEAQKAMGRDDPEAAGVVVSAVRADGVTIREEARVKSVARAGSTIKVEIETAGGEETIEGSHLLVATGRRPNVEGLGLDLARINTDERGAVLVDSSMCTSNRRVFAIGDVAGGFQFTHWANYHAGLVIRSILFRMHATENTDVITWVTYTDPELAHVGLTEEQARRRHKGVRVLRWPLAENDRAQAERRTQGFVKVVTDRKGRILGVDVVGHNAGEQIALWTLAISQGLDVKAVTGLVLPYPTLTESAKRAAILFYTPSLTNPWLRRIIRFLRLFG